MTYISNGNYKLIPGRLVMGMLSVMADVDPDIIDDIANEMIDKLAPVIKREIDHARLMGRYVVSAEGDAPVTSNEASKP